MAGICSECLFVLLVATLKIDFPSTRELIGDFFEKLSLFKVFGSNHFQNVAVSTKINNWTNTP